MNNKNSIRIIAVLFSVLLLMTAGLTACGKKAPESVSLLKSSYLFMKQGETMDLNEQIEVTGDNADAELKYSSSDESVFSVSQDGLLTVNGDGNATLTVSAAADEKVKAEAYILVYDYSGVYSGEKYIDAMGCDIRIRLKLDPDGTLEYYRYPMFVALDGGGAMPDLYDHGKYTMENGSINIEQEFLGSYHMDFKFDTDGLPNLSGSMPTGGADTQIQLMKNTAEDRGETGIYKGHGENAEGTLINYELQLDSGSYKLRGNEETLSEGTYTFENEKIEFWAETGASFGARYDQARGVVEGTAIPVDPDHAEDNTAVTLTLDK